MVAHSMTVGFHGEETRYRQRAREFPSGFRIRTYVKRAIRNSSRKQKARTTNARRASCFENPDPDRNNPDVKRSVLIEEIEIGRLLRSGIWPRADERSHHCTERPPANISPATTKSRRTRSEAAGAGHCANRLFLRHAQRIVVQVKEFLGGRASESCKNRKKRLKPPIQARRKELIDEKHGFVVRL